MAPIQLQYSMSSDSEIEPPETRKRKTKRRRTATYSSSASDLSDSNSAYDEHSSIKTHSSRNYEEDNRKRKRTPTDVSKSLGVGVSASDAQNPSRSSKQRATTKMDPRVLARIRVKAQERRDKQKKLLDNLQISAWNLRKEKDRLTAENVELEEKVRWARSLSLLVGGGVAEAYPTPTTASEVRLRFCVYVYLMHYLCHVSQFHSSRFALHSDLVFCSGLCAALEFVVASSSTDSTTDVPSGFFIRKNRGCRYRVTLKHRRRSDKTTDNSAYRVCRWCQ